MRVIGLSTFPGSPPLRAPANLCPDISCKHVSYHVNQRCHYELSNSSNRMQVQVAGFKITGAC